MYVLFKERPAPAPEPGRTKTLSVWMLRAENQFLPDSLTD